MTPNKKIRIELTLFENQIIYNGYSPEKDVSLFNALERLRRQLLE